MQLLLQVLNKEPKADVSAADCCQRVDEAMRRRENDDRISPI